MADLLRVRRRPARRQRFAATTAAAKILAPTRADEPTPEAWHPDAWFFRNTTGELRHAETWLGNSMGRARLIAARRRAPGAEPEVLPEDHPASVYMAQLAGGVGGQSALLRAWGTYLMTPGVGFMCGYDPRDGGGATWQVRSADEVRLSSRLGADGRPVYEVQNGDLTTDWVPLDDGLVVKVHRPDPQRHWRPDSPVRGAMSILRELTTLTAAIEATAVSRLAGAGLLPLPQEMELPRGWEQFEKEFVETITRPISDRGSAAAVVPFLLRMKGEWIDKIKLVQFSTPFDEHSVELRQELIERLATAMDMPARALTNEQENHWGKAITAEEGVKIHVQPNLELVCDGITKGYLLPALVGEARSGGVDLDLPEGGRILAEAIQAENIVDGDGQQIIAWYDLSDFTAKPDRSDDTVLAYDRYEATGDALRSETGLSEVEPPDNGEVERRLLIKVAEPGGDAALQRAALIKLGVFTEDEVPEPVAPVVDEVPVGDDPEEPVPEVGPVPDTAPDDPAPSERDVPDAVRPTTVRAADVALVVAADALVCRAIERAGNRLRNVTARQRATDATLDQPPHLMHTACNAARVRPLDTLLDGAWERVPEYAGRVGVCPATLQATLDDYTRHLITSRTVHSWDLLEAYLAAAPTMSPAEQVLAALRVAS